MPCSDGGPSYEQMESERKAKLRCEKERKLVVSVLCGICTALENPLGRGVVSHLPAVLDRIDWEEAGIKRTEFAVWWDRHKEEDRQRREAEEQSKRKANKKASARAIALAKLSLADRKALGL